MRRVAISPRVDWQSEVERHGLIYHTFEGKPYWNESAFYEFTADEVDALETATNDLHGMCLQAAEKVIAEDRFAEFGISPEVADAIRLSWKIQPASLYGRFDFGFDGNGAPKLFEYNADTPTSLLEAAVIQWQWLQDYSPDFDQFNSIWEGLLELWGKLKSERRLPWDRVHFASEDHWEDQMTLAVLMDTAEQSGLTTIALGMQDIGWNDQAKEFRDLAEQPISSIFKLYPWEHMVEEDFGKFALNNQYRTQWIEPVWKMLLSNKALMALLWEMCPGHPNLLPAYLDGPRELTDYVIKPCLGREGSNVEIVRAGEKIASDGPYSHGAKIWQGLYDLPDFEGNHPVIGSWVIGSESRGMGIRETDGLITDDLARFVPHRFA